MKHTIKETDWVPVKTYENARSQRRLSADHIYMRFLKKKRKNMPESEWPIFGTIKIGDHIMSVMKWKKGDRMILCKNPDNEFSFMLTKSENGIGFLLKNYTIQRMLNYIEFEWDGVSSPELLKMFRFIKPTMQKNRLFFEYKE